MTTVTPRQHLILIAAVLALSALALYFAHRKSIAPRIETARKALRDDEARLDFVKRDLASRQQPDVEAMRRAVLDAEGRLRGVKIEGSGTAGRFISTRPASELAAFLGSISTEARRRGLDIARHSAVNAPNALLKDLIIRELEVTGSFGAVAAFIEHLPALPYRVLILKTQLDHKPDAFEPLRAVIRFSL
jgi:hypothetical protein